MQVTETLSQGLKRELNIVVPAADLSKRLDERLAEMKDRVQIKGFRPGKVPTAHLKRLAGRQEMAQIIDSTISDTIRQVIEDRKERPALNPEVKLVDEAGIEKVIDGAADLAFSAAYDLLPDFEIQDFSSIELERPVAELPADEVEEAVKRLADSARPYTDKGDAAAADGDKVNIDFVGKIDDVAFPGGTGEGADLVLGSSQFIPGFEAQLVGAKAGDKVDVKVSFPEDYQAAELAGKPAVFEVTVKSVSAPGEVELNDEWASKLGVESVDKIREIFREQAQARYTAASRAKLKRALLDKLDEAYSFDLPERLVESEFEQIWKQVETEMSQSGKTFADEDTTEEAARADYRKIAVRRVRLGLVLSEIGEKNAVQVTEDEVGRALMERARQFPGQEKQVFDYYRSNPMALATLRAPLFEEKVVDFIVEKAKVTEKPVTKDELFAEAEED